jgi:hypothetical protein
MRLRDSGTVIVATTLMLASGCGNGSPAETSPSQPSLKPFTIERADCKEPEGNLEVRLCKQANAVPNNAPVADHFDSLGEAADFAEQVTGRPAPIPRELRLTGDVDVHIAPDETVQLTLTQGDRPLVLRYGKAIGFDGCEPPDAKSVEIGDARGLLAAHDVPGKNDFHELIWPATEDRPVGTLGISGQLPRGQVLSAAAGIQEVAKGNGGGSTPRGC